MADLLDEMDPEKSEKKKRKKLIQLERTRTAFERLQLAWVRTSLTILVIGVGVYEFYYNRHELGKKPLFEAFTGRELSFILYCIAFSTLVISLLQHRKSMAKLKEEYPESRYSVATLLSVILLILAFFLTGLLLWRA